MRAHANRQAQQRPWGIWDLDAEMRYWPVLNALPDGPVCEIGSGTAGLASWTEREIIGIDPSEDQWHEGMLPLPNLRRLVGDGRHLPLADQSVAAAVAVDTFEHIWPVGRQLTVEEMIRVTRPGGRVIIIGPVGAAAAAGDRWLWDSWQPNPPPWLMWLTQHFERGVPSFNEMNSMFTNPRIAQVRSSGFLNIWLWRAMHKSGFGGRFGRWSKPGHPAVGRIARRFHRGPFYRWMFVIDLLETPKQV